MKVPTRLLISLAFVHGATAAIMPTGLRCEHHSNPAAIGTTVPRFSWKIQSAEPRARHAIQSAYDLEVTREVGNPLWASGKVESPATDQIEYAGERLEWRDRAVWRVRVWDGGGRQSPWSEPATFAVGLLEQRDWSALWISMADNHTLSATENVQNFVGDPRRGTLHLTPAKYFRKEFQAPAVTRATVHATALGVYTLEINGRRVSPERLAPGWSSPGFDDAAWEPAVAKTGSDSRVEPHPGVPVLPIEEIKPVSVREQEPRRHIFDLGQNISGVIRLKVKGKAGDEVTMRFAEALHLDGRLSTENLRCARAVNTYTLKGDPDGEEWIPEFTFHGFQYVELTGFPGTPDPGSVTGIVLHSDTPLHGGFTCSDPMLDRLDQNIVWTQRANFFEMLTDCPQRDERMGWTGDAQIYVRAATCNADIASFYTKWLSTGFLGTRPLLPVLSAHGHHDVAGILIQQREYPGWGYGVENGATTIRERWNSYIKDKGPHEPAMNSFSHYAFGAVCEWMFADLADIDHAAPGFERIRIEPRRRARSPMFFAALETRHGRLASEGKLDDGKFAATLTIPPNTPADVTLPANGAITGNGQAPAGRPGMISSEGNPAELDSGTCQLETSR